ncbi:MAG: transcription-repair coupling factor [Haliscomenobacter sp.]|nr:transcription-repair coupling factor [Haliscomenobacter sp.]
MNNKDRILELYRKDRRIERLVSYLSHSPSAKIHLGGVVGALEAFAIAGAYFQHPRFFLLVEEDKDAAAYLQNDLEGLFEKKSIHFFPDSFKRPGFFEEVNPTNVQMRTELVNILSQSKAAGEIIVTYPEALFEKVLSPEVLQANRLDIAAGEKLSVEDMIEFLLDFGFTREDFVFEPGQFSIRGGIVDIFSYGNDFPYRIELFDVEVENIRTFNPLTQLSLAQIHRVSIIPNINRSFKQEQKVSLLDVLPPETLCWVKDPEILLNKIQHCFEQAGEHSRTISVLDESEAAAIFKDQAFNLPREIMGRLQELPIVSFQPSFFQYNENIVFQAKPQPSFNRNFDLLISELKSNQKQGIENFIFSDSARQVERFYAIFEDLEAHVSFHPITHTIHEGFIDLDQKVACFTDHQIFERFHRYKLRQGFSKEQALTMRLLRDLQPGDFVTHIDHGIGRFSGLEKININGHIQESVRLIYKNNDILYVSINSLHKIAKYTGQEGTPPQLSKLGSDAWKNLKNKTRKKVKDIAGELIKLYAKRKSAPGFAFSPDGYLQTELEASFIYEDTPDQLKATNDVKADMTKPYPMDRLICGDVGFGKTEVAIRAAFKAITDGKQVAILVPTTILALQHYKTFSDRLKEFDLRISYLNRFRTAKQKKEILEALKAGKLDLIIATHSLLSKDVAFKDLGLLIVDEEQKFGVSAKEKLRSLKVNVDTLTLTATPIPRTLQFSLMAARDLSVIRTPPPNRQPIHTEVRQFSDGVIRDSIYFEVNRGGQVFFVHNRVKNLGEITAMVRQLCPDVNVGIAHGQMDAEHLEQALLDFIERKYDVLVCTNIIETGLDIPNANTMIINNAHQFGMSDLHQLRGRVGRSNKKAFCYLFSPPLSTLTAEARKRLRTLEEFSDLGSGFQIAMRDLDIRGAGNLLGAEQSGFIADIGYETYQKILEEAVQELKETEFRDLFEEELSRQNYVYVRDVQIDTDVEMHIPDGYVSSIQERLNLYTEIDKLEQEDQIAAFKEQLRDRFGRVPAAVMELFEGLRLRWSCKQFGIERVLLKNGKFRAYFVENPQSPFYESAQFKRVLEAVSHQGPGLGISLKQSNNHLLLVKDGVANLKDARNLLESLAQNVEAA